VYWPTGVENRLIHCVVPASTSRGVHLTSHGVHLTYHGVHITYHGVHLTSRGVHMTFHGVHITCVRVMSFYEAQLT
jgi:hypothetical protein